MKDLTILDAMAERLKSVEPPEGYSLRNVYATPQESLPVVPAIVFFPGDDTVSIGSANRSVTLTVNAVLYLTPIPRMDQKYRDLYTWRSWMRDAFNADVTIDGNAAQVTVTSTTLGTDTYADQDYLTVTAAVEVLVYEAIAYSE